MRMDSIASALVMKNLYVQRSSFERIGPELTDGKLTIQVSREIKSADSNAHEVSLSIELSNEAKEFRLAIKFVGIFEVTADSEEIARDLLEKNTVAIMFPYVRAQVSLMTSQPGMSPIVVPPININTMLDNLS